MVKRWCANKQQREIIRTDDDDDDDDDYAFRVCITQQTELIILLTQRRFTAHDNHAPPA